jgi:VPDSG-CTERM motif
MSQPPRVAKSKRFAIAEEMFIPWHFSCSPEGVGKKNANTIMKKLITVSLYLIIGALVSDVALAAGPPNPVPDAASSASLLGMALAGLTVIRRYVR